MKLKTPLTINKAPLYLAILALVIGATFWVGRSTLEASAPKESSPSMNTKNGERFSSVAIRFSTGALINNATTSFISPEFIYAHLQFPIAVKGDHLLEGVWSAPNGRPQENTRVPLRFPPAGGRSAYLWIRFNPSSSGGGLPALDGDEPARNDFNGVWTLETMWDGRLVSRSTFSVCGLARADTVDEIPNSLRRKP